MRITVNGDPTEHEGSLVDLLGIHHSDRAARGIAVAINGEVVARSAWDTCALAPGDCVEIVTAVQGG